jgi:uncharacterized protein (UPF0216 family)
MITYDRIRNNEKLVISLTGLAPSEFEILLPSFGKAEDIAASQKIEETRRERVCGGGRKPSLRTLSDKLLFILFYFKRYPSQILIGFLFGMNQSRANERIHRLSGILKTALAETGHMPERDPEKLSKTLSEDGAKNVITDGAERKIQRPEDENEQKKYYSGKKKAHTVKNNVVVGAEDRKVKYLSGTCEGKKHDKKLCGGENLTFPDNITLYKDRGFRGYEPEGVNTKQPKKKPEERELSADEKVENALISGIRIVAEHVISGVKRCRIVKDVFRNTKKKFDDLVMEIACGLHNFRTSCR